MEPIYDLEPQLANNRAFWLGYGAEDRQDNGLTLYRSGLPDAQLNGVLRVTPGSLDRTCITVDGYRRRGIGAAMTAAALRAGQERGRRIGTLQASPLGQPVYQRMGFQVVAEYQIFTLPVSLR